MKLLAGKLYDPTSSATGTLSSLKAITAMDTTNARLTFTAPSNGSVLVIVRTVWSGATTSPQFLLGVLDGATVKARMSPVQNQLPAVSSGQIHCHAAMVITGLAGGTSYTWDAAYGVEILFAGTVIKWGGADDTTANTSFGGLAFEIYDTPGLLASAAYDPGTAASTFSTNAATVMTALDTTNLRLTFTAPSSGKVYVRLRGVITATTVTNATWHWGVLDGATIRFRQTGAGGRNQLGSAAATDHLTREAAGLVTGLTPGTSYTWDAACGVEIALTSGTVNMGGPNNSTTNDAWGQFAFDIWNVDDLPRAIGSSV